MNHFPNTQPTTHSPVKKVGWCGAVKIFSLYTGVRVCCGSAWRGVSSEDQFFSEIESAFDDEPRVQKCRDVVGILRKASGGRCGGPYLGPTAGYSFSFEDNSGTFEMTYWHTYEPSNNDIAQDFKVETRAVVRDFTPGAS
jgi:hypothetical protein